MTGLLPFKVFTLKLNYNVFAQIFYEFKGFYKIISYKINICVASKKKVTKLKMDEL